MIALTLLSSVVLSAPAQTVQALASPLSEFESWTVQFSKSYSNTVSALKRRARVLSLNISLLVTSLEKKDDKKK